MAIMSEIGRIGQKRYGGKFYEEFLQELSGKRGIAVYKEMSDNDDIIGAVFFAIKYLIRQATWDIQPGGAETADEEAAEFVRSCMDDMSDTWTDTISEILSFLIYGWSAHEIVYKRRCGRNRDVRLNSKYDDRLIGWRRLPIRAQETLYQWEYKPGTDELEAMVQMPPPDFGLITIPIKKLILFRTESNKNNPEGRSLLRNCYRSWYFKKRIQEIEGIGIERDLAGLPTLTAPEGIDIWSKSDPLMTQIREGAERLIQNIRRDETEGVVIPFGWKLELLSTGGTRQFDTSQVIDRYDTRIAQTVMADFIMLGHQSVGSFALSDNKTELFGTAIGGFLDIICETFNNNAIPKLVDINGDAFAGITDYPKMIHGDIENEDLSKLGEFIDKMCANGVIMPDEGLEDYVRAAAGLPERVDGRNDYNIDTKGGQAGMEANRNENAEIRETDG